MTIKLRSKVVEIEAVLWDGSDESLKEIDEFVGALNLSYSLLTDTIDVWNELEEQWIHVPLGHYVLRGLKGEFYPCEQEALFMKYDIVEGIDIHEIEMKEIRDQ